MKRLAFHLFCSLLVLAAGFVVPADADQIVNGGFEQGFDVTIPGNPFIGWDFDSTTWLADSAQFDISDPSNYPLGPVGSVVDIFPPVIVIEGIPLDPVDILPGVEQLDAAGGDYFAKLRTGHILSTGDLPTGMVSNENAHPTVSQTLNLNAQDIISGSASFFTLEPNSGGSGLELNDRAYVNIRHTDSADAITVWSAEAQYTADEASRYKTFADYTGTSVGGFISGWENWSWTADTAGTYELTFGVINEELWDGSLLSQKDTWAFFDNVVHQPVPEPATMLLVGTGLIGIAGLRRRKR